MQRRCTHLDVCVIWDSDCKPFVHRICAEQRPHACNYPEIGSTRFKVCMSHLAQHAKASQEAAVLTGALQLHRQEQPLLVADRVFVTNAGRQSLGTECMGAQCTSPDDAVAAEHRQKLTPQVRAATDKCLVQV